MTPGVIAPEGAFVLVGSKPRAAWPVTLPPPAAAVSSKSLCVSGAGGLERLWRERNGRLAHAKGSDDRGHQAEYGERV